ncbi:MAG: ribosome maturation factor RimP [Oscillospiraceae bacterium]|nr:ribosome maturation factor RimP [Oscillospiraceae bacterium]
MAKGTNTTAVVEQLVAPVIQEKGCVLWDVRFEKEGPDWILRIWLDRVKEPLDMDTVEDLTRAINPILDEADPIDQSYYLEVGSPGLGRKLTKPFHFTQKQGQEVLVHLYQSQNGSKDYVGILTNRDEKTTVIVGEEGQTAFENGQIAYVKLNDDADLF